MNVLDEVAARYGGASTQRGLEMTARLGSGDLAVRTGTGGMTVWTLIVAKPGFPEFIVRRRRFFDGLFSAGAIELEDEDFDGHFLVTGADPAAVRRVWSQATMERMLSAFSTGGLVSRKQKIVLGRARILSTVEDAVNGIELLRELASQDLLGLAALGSLPDVAMREDLALFPDGVRIGPLVVEGQAITRALATSPANVAWAFEVDDGKAAEADLERLPADVRDLVSSLGTARISSIDGEAQVRWKTIETDPTRLAAAIAILRALARGPSLGAFR